MNKPLLIGGNGGNDTAYVERSIFSSYKNGLPALTGRVHKRGDGTIRLYGINATIPMLYSLAYRQITNYSKNRFCYEVKHSDRFEPNKSGDQKLDDWKLANLYCYDLVMPYHDENTSSKKVLSDLNTFFNAEGKIVKRVNDCLVLIRLDKSDINMRSKDNVLGKKRTISFTNRNISSLISAIDEASDIPVLDETGYKGKINIDLHSDLTNIASLRIELKSYGFDLIKEKRELEFFTLTGNP
jgi:hypothetical protein